MVFLPIRTRPTTDGGGGGGLMSGIPSIVSVSVSTSAVVMSVRSTDASTFGVRLGVWPGVWASVVCATPPYNSNAASATSAAPILTEVLTTVPSSRAYQLCPPGGLPDDRLLSIAFRSGWEFSPTDSSSCIA